uniref:Uncharacterized protein n=1 Tax=Mus musculus TaxID=10090 RepID=Q8BQA5_MOUSE|nr:unnamed protein product [Mus musculus]
MNAKSADKDSEPLSQWMLSGTGSLWQVPELSPYEMSLLCIPFFPVPHLLTDYSLPALWFFFQSLLKWSSFVIVRVQRGQSSQLEAGISGRHIINRHRLLFRYKLTGNFSRLTLSSLCLSLTHSQLEAAHTLHSLLYSAFFLCTFLFLNSHTPTHFFFFFLIFLLYIALVMVFCFVFIYYM